MTEGLVTRIGRWIDTKWEPKATERQVISVVEVLERKILGLSERIDLLRTPEGVEKDVAELKTRLEKMELYSGMTRKVDPTKPAVVKSAFSM